MALAGASNPLAFIENRDLFGDLAESERFKDAYQETLRSLTSTGRPRRSRRSRTTPASAAERVTDESSSARRWGVCAGTYGRPGVARQLCARRRLSVAAAVEL